MANAFAQVVIEVDYVLLEGIKVEFQESNLYSFSIISDCFNQT